VDVIPVIDLKGGTVVHARAGQRDRYAPLRSDLCAGSAPLVVARALLDMYPFSILYLADLDAIAGTGDHDTHIADIAQALPQVALWVDCGLGDATRVDGWWARDRATAVVGTESVASPAALRKLARATPDARWVLSLDHRPEETVDGDSWPGASELWNDVASWPSRIIAMTLGRVGSRAGPDLARVAALRARAGDRKIYAAGGVRGGADLLALAGSAVSGVLVATALHERAIGPDEIAAVASGPTCR
jgi:phosphoribosylformimino-5-aminoimidazole carboxamide ribotide isomerase